MASELAAHLQRFPAAGEELTFTSREGGPLHRGHFNPYVWRKALAAASVEPSRANDMHALRHFYASSFDAGESVKAVAEYLGHGDPGFTLRVYAHLFPSSEDRARAAVDRVFLVTDRSRTSPVITATTRSSDGPQTDQTGS